MPESIGASGAPYLTQIPRIDENADIQTALRLYHYGSDTNNPDTILANSIVGHFNSLDESKIDKDPVNLTTGDNLDDYVATGYFVQTSTTNARTGTRYPEAKDPENNLRFFAGLLKVVNDGGVVFQEYHMIGDTGYILNKVFWRVRYANEWSAWVEFVSPTAVDAVVAEHSHAKGVTWTRTEIAERYAPIRFEETSIKTTNYTLALSDLNKIVHMNVSGGGTLTVPTTSVAFLPGSIINIYNSSADVLTIVGATEAVVIRNNGTLEQYKEASLRYRGSNEWVAAGPLY
jgi:hypothetical protein